MKQILTLIALLLCLPAFAANWYVATTGSDSNAGTSFGAPYATFAKALTSASPGDFVETIPGTYNQQICDGPATGCPNKSGTAGNPITITCTGPGPCLITNVGATKVAILLSQVSYITIDAIDVDGGNFVPFANTNAAIKCTAAAFSSAPNVGFWASVENVNHIIIQNGIFQHAIGFSGIQIASRYLANGQPWLSNPSAQLSGHTSYVTVQGNYLDSLGNLRDIAGTCGDVIDIGTGMADVGTIDHILIQNNTLGHGSHDLIQGALNDSIIQGNTLTNSWADLYSPFKNGMRAGYRIFEILGNSNVIQNNTIGPDGCCSGGNSSIPPLVEVHGQKNLVKRNVFRDAVANAINMDCGLGGWDNVQFNHYAHNTFYGLDGSAWSAYAYSADPCSKAGNHWMVNNLIYEDRRNWAVSAPIIVLQDVDVMNVLSGPNSAYIDVGLGPVGQNTYTSNLWAPSLTLPTVKSSRPTGFFNFGVSGQQPICLTQANTTACPNTSTGELTFSAYLLADNIDAGVTPSLRPAFSTGTPVAYGDYALTPTSSGVDQGRCLTTTTSSGTSSTTIPVADAYYFTDGKGITTGDTIELCNHGTQTVITSISYGTYPAGTLTVSPAVPAFSSGEGVTYAYSGIGPDIGAIELGVANGPSTLQPQTWVRPICQSTGKVESNPANCH